MPPSGSPPPTQLPPHPAPDPAHMLRSAMERAPATRPSLPGTGNFAKPPVLIAPQRERSTIGPIIGVVIIIVLLGFGALYFWGAYLNKREQSETLPLIPAQQN